MPEETRSTQVGGVAKRRKIPFEPLLEVWNRIELERPTISQKELALIWGKSEGAVSQYLRGHTKLNLPAQLMFARYLRVPVTTIWPDFEFRDMCPGELPPEAILVATDWLRLKDPLQREHFAALLRSTVQHQ